MLATSRRARRGAYQRNCDVLVVGAGPAGLAAALAAAEAGKRVILVDEQTEARRLAAVIATPRSTASRDGNGRASLRCRAARRRRSASLPAPTAFGIYDHGLVGL